ncbi:MAG: Lrp/AsnC family transcriptional regulator [Candidatus Thorarchaeota archaeon]
MDKTDKRILELLQEDGRLTVSAISKEVGKGISTVHARINSLRERGIIDKFTAILNPSSLGRPTLAVILVTIRYRVPGSRKVISQREFCEEIAQHPIVQEVHVLSGEFDVLLKVRTKDVQEMNNFIVDSLREMPAVEKTLTMFAMDTYLDTLMLRNL